MFSRQSSWVHKHMHHMQFGLGSNIFRSPPPHYLDKVPPLALCLLMPSRLMSNFHFHHGPCPAPSPVAKAAFDACFSGWSMSHNCPGSLIWFARAAGPVWARPGTYGYVTLTRSTQSLQQCIFGSFSAWPRPRGSSIVLFTNGIVPLVSTWNGPDCSPCCVYMWRFLALGTEPSPAVDGERQPRGAKSAFCGPLQELCKIAWQLKTQNIYIYILLHICIYIYTHNFVYHYISPLWSVNSDDTSHDFASRTCTLCCVLWHFWCSRTVTSVGCPCDECCATGATSERRWAP